MQFSPRGNASLSMESQCEAGKASYVTKDDWNQSLPKRKPRYPVLGPYLEMIDTWLTEEQALPRKQRYTSKRIFDRLCDEYGFEGGRRTVDEYVAKRRKELKLERAESYERLEPSGATGNEFVSE